MATEHINGEINSNPEIVEKALQAVYEVLYDHGLDEFDRQIVLEQVTAQLYTKYVGPQLEQLERRSRQLGKTYRPPLASLPPGR